MSVDVRKALAGVLSHESESDNRIRTIEFLSNLHLAGMFLLKIDFLRALMGYDTA